MKKIPHQLKVLDNKPLDGRCVFNTIDEAMASAYDGLICYIRNEKRHYRFKEVNYVLTAIPDDIVDVSGFATKDEVKDKADKVFVENQLSNKSNIGHSHPDYAPVNHSHDYIPNAELSNLATKNDLAGKASVSHNHDERYSTIGHTHSNYQLDIESLQNLVNVGRLSLNQLNADYITRQEYVQGSGIQQYVHPETHPSTMITTTPERRFTSDGEMDSKVDKVEGSGLISDEDKARIHDHGNAEALNNVSGINTGDETVDSIGSLIAGATAKTTPVDADSVGLSDSAASNAMKKLTWANLKAALKSYFDTVYTTLTSSNPSALGASASVGTATTAARADHVHPLPAVATASDSGLMSASDKAKLDGITGTNTGDETTSTLGSKIAGATAKTTPVDADSVGLSDSAASNVMKKLTWANLKAALKSYFDTVYTTLTSSNPSALGASASVGTATTAARADHVHPLPAVATASDSGLMSASDKAKLDGITGTNTGDETTSTLGSKIAGATAKTTPVDADSVGLSDSAASNAMKKLTWANLKAALKSYFDTVYTTLTSSNPSALGASASVGTATTAARADHVHPLPAVATTSANGLMSASDKAKLDGITGTNTGDETTSTLGSKIAGATAKTTPVDADSVGLSDSAASNAMKKLTWANLKAALKSYFDTVYTTLTSSNPSALGASASVGTATTAARADHVHPLPAVATTSANGLMSASDKSRLDRNNRITPQTLTDSSTISWDCNNGLNAFVQLGGNRSLSIANVQSGEFGLLIVKQDSSGNRTLTLPSNSKMMGGSIIFSTSPNATDILMFYYDGNYFHWTIGKNYY